MTIQHRADPDLRPPQAGRGRGSGSRSPARFGVPHHTLTKIAQGATPNPRIETVQRSVDHFNGQQIDAEVNRELIPWTPLLPRRPTNAQRIANASKAARKGRLEATG